MMAGWCDDQFVLDVICPQNQRNDNAAEIGQRLFAAKHVGVNWRAIAGVGTCDIAIVDRVTDVAVDRVLAAERTVDRHPHRLTEVRPQIITDQSFLPNALLA
jgi:hypothetical protein